MKNIELSACEEMIMTIIWNNEAELDLAAVMTQTNERYHTAWKPQTVWSPAFVFHKATPS